MILTPAIKGQLTRAVNLKSNPGESTTAFVERCRVDGARLRRQAVRAVFSRHMPAEQAKHATRAYLANI